MKSRHVRKTSCNRAFVIKGTDEVLKDAMHRTITEITHPTLIRKYNKKYFYKKPDGHEIELEKYKTLRSREYRQGEGKKMVDSTSGEPLKDSSGQEVMFDDPRIAKQQFGQYSFKDNGSTKEIPVKKLWAYQKEKTRQNKMKKDNINNNNASSTSSEINNNNSTINQLAMVSNTEEPSLPKKSVDMHKLLNTDSSSVAETGFFSPNYSGWRLVRPAEKKTESIQADPSGNEFKSLM